MNEISPTWTHIISVWWLLCWRGLLGGLILGALAGFVFGVVCYFLQADQRTAQLGGQIAGGIVGLLWGVVATRMALRKRYSGFRLAVVTEER